MGCLRQEREMGQGSWAPDAQTAAGDHPEAVQKRLHLLSADAGVAHLGQRLRYAAETGGALSAAQETAPKASTPVNTSVQFTSLHSSWSQPGKPVRASKSAGSVTETDSLEGHAVQVQRARRLLHQPGDRAAEGSEVQLCNPPGGGTTSNGGTTSGGTGSCVQAWLLEKPPRG